MTTLADLIRPSAMHRLAACPGSGQLGAAVINECGLPASSPEAQVGNDVHLALCEAIEQWKAGSTWEECKAWVAMMHPGLDAWSAACVRDAIDFVAALIERAGVEPEHVLPEHHLAMDAYGIVRGGTADLVLVLPFRRAVVVDLKAGFIDQGDADQHDQLAVYATAAADTFAVPTVEVVILQPRQGGARRATAAVFDADTLRATGQWVRSVVARAKADDPELTPGYAQCLHCPALSRCPAAQEWIMRTREALELIGPPADAAAWGEAIGAAKVAEKWADAVKEQGKAHLLAGGAADGWGLAEGRTITSCTNHQEALRRLDAAGLGAEARYALTISPAKLTEPALAAIEGLIATKTSAPSLRPVKGTKP